MPHILIVYDTTEGQTRKIAQHVADVACGLGHQVELRAIRGLSGDFTMGRFDAVIIGASIHMGKHPKRLAQFVSKHRADLERKPAAFFSVSLSAAMPKGWPSSSKPGLEASSRPQPFNEVAHAESEDSSLGAFGGRHGGCQGPCPIPRLLG